MAKLSHVDERGTASMVDVSAKLPTARVATAQAILQISRALLGQIAAGNVAKGDVLGVARVAGIQAAKRTSELIPLCHPLMLTKVQIEFDAQLERERLVVRCTCHVIDRTGVEMEALTGAAVAALTVYDMCKAAQRDIVIGDVCLLHKKGGKTGDWQRAELPS